MSLDDRQSSVKDSASANNGENPNVPAEASFTMGTSGSASAPASGAATSPPQRNGGEPSQPRVRLGDLAGAGLEGIEAPQRKAGIAILRIQQPSSKNVSRPGTFQAADTLESAKVINGAAVLRVRATRRLYADDRFDGESPLRCWSDDGKKPSTEVKSPLATTCAGCPKNVWKKEGGRNLPPECREMLTAMVRADLGSGQRVYRMDIGGTSYKALKNYIDWLSANALPAYGATMNMSLEAQPGNKGTYYRLTIDNWTVVEEDQLEALHALYNRVKAAALGARIADESR